MDYSIENIDPEVLANVKKLERAGHEKVFLNPQTGEVVIVGRKDAIKIRINEA